MIYNGQDLGHLSPILLLAIKSKTENFSLNNKKYASRTSEVHPCSVLNGLQGSAQLYTTSKNAVFMHLGICWQMRASCKIGACLPCKHCKCCKHCKTPWTLLAWYFPTQPQLPSQTMIICYSDAKPSTQRWFSLLSTHANLNPATFLLKSGIRS